MKAIIRLIVLLSSFLSLIGCSNEGKTEPANTIPTISNQTFTIEEDASAGTSLGTVVASDADRDVIAFRITDGNLA